MRRIILALSLAIMYPAAAVAHGHHQQHSSMWWYWQISAKFGHAAMATWYGPGFYGHRTACGEVYTGRGLTAAHKTLPCGTHVRVTNLQNHRSITLTINDRGPYRAGAVLDLSPASRDALGARSSIPVSVEVVR